MCDFQSLQHTPNFADHRLPAAKRRRLIDATKVLLDVAKESSDWFPPLKSCLGGINALIKHYDVRSCEYPPSTSPMYFLQEVQDVKDKLEDLIPWVTKLKGSLAVANPKDDREEAERRTQLTKFASHLCSLATIN